MRSRKRCATLVTVGCVDRETHLIQSTYRFSPLGMHVRYLHGYIVVVPFACLCVHACARVCSINSLSVCVCVSSIEESCLIVREKSID